MREGRGAGADGVGRDVERRGLPRGAQEGLPRLRRARAARRAVPAGDQGRRAHGPRGRAPAGLRERHVLRVRGHARAPRPRAARAHGPARRAPRPRRPRARPRGPRHHGRVPVLLRRLHIRPQLVRGPRALGVPPPLGRRAPRVPPGARRQEARRLVRRPQRRPPLGRHLQPQASRL